MLGDPDAQLAQEFAEIARQLQAAAGLDDTHTIITRIAVDTVEGCAHAAITLTHRDGRMRTVAPTDPVAALVDIIQYQEREGPCVYAATDDRNTTRDTVYQSDDLTTETRWPAFARRAVTETDIRSMLSLRLATRNDAMGALNLYSPTPAAFTDRAQEVAAILAAHAAVALDAAHQHKRSENLEAALDSNRRIGTAMGILMTRRHLTEDDAFAALRRASQHLNLKLRDIADDVIHTGQLPGDVPRTRRP